MKQKILTLALMASFLLFSGCYPDGAENTEDFDIVYTSYDQGYNFQNAGTYSMPDEIVILGDSEEPEFIPDIYADEIIANIERNLSNLGWTRVTNDANPDVQLLLGSWTTTTISYWGGGYWCYWDPYYCGGGWYYPYPVVTSYTTGTLVMDMVVNQTAGGKKGVWTGALNGLFEGNFDGSRITKGINQAFAQSPYLKIN
ncbi:hypothetical protein FEDK69T_02910 [Flavobacterium enshiense DK69]|uniref:DUF4136 domain-containing protein n=1 Tax=Flavobacterium enshiense DK69 TaxID=1107311 RepID=V6SE51_9FLAO|nr:DUF4136 domain-containing protein [Flavobacterium enshiense]ESU24739.1 hypothetical protein FEDK69T_02910 [Flavobacterium enshiense DK69]KGO96804.1 hypothetical protein Q767_03615 [Flavobacterium enshiense DK69]